MILNNIPLLLKEKYEIDELFSVPGGMLSTDVEVDMREWINPSVIYVCNYMSSRHCFNAGYANIC